MKAWIWNKRLCIQCDMDLRAIINSDAPALPANSRPFRYRINTTVASTSSSSPNTPWLSSAAKTPIIVPSPQSGTLPHALPLPHISPNVGTTHSGAAVHASPIQQQYVRSILQSPSQSPIQYQSPYRTSSLHQHPQQTVPHGQSQLSSPKYTPGIVPLHTPTGSQSHIYAQSPQELHRSHVSLHSKPQLQPQPQPQPYLQHSQTQSFSQPHFHSQSHSHSNSQHSQPPISQPQHQIHRSSPRFDTQESPFSQVNAGHAPHMRQSPQMAHMLPSQNQHFFHAQQSPGVGSMAHPQGPVP